MVRSYENNTTLIAASNHQVIREGKMALGISQNRRALSSLNQNIIGESLFPDAGAAKKKGLSKENVACYGLIPRQPNHRPITRKYAADLADKKHRIIVNKVPNPTKWEDCDVIDFEDDPERTNDEAVPMFVQHTQALLDQIDEEMEEVEMEDVEPVIDIDSCDKNNPLSVVTYIDDIYANYRKLETSFRISPNYMDWQLDVNASMRDMLVDWIVEVHHKFNLSSESLYLAVNVLDRFLAVKRVLRTQLQLIGLTSLMIASKYEDVLCPEMEDLLYITDMNYSRQQVLDMEKVIINALDFQLSIPTAYMFMKRFLKAAQSNNRQIENMSYFLVELTLVDYDMLRFSPSHIAAAAVFTAQCTLNRSREWSKTIEWHSNYSEKDLIECSRLMVVRHRNAARGKLRGVHNKYGSVMYGYASYSQPAGFLLEA